MYNIDSKNVRFFKEAILASTEDNVKTVLSKYITQAIK